MTITTALALGETALKLGLICSLTVLALFLSYSMLNVCDLSTDGCFTLGAAVGAAAAIAGHPFLSIAAAMLLRVPGDPAYTAKHDGSDDDRRQVEISSQELHHNNALLSARFEKFFT